MLSFARRLPARGGWRQRLDALVAKAALLLWRFEPRALLASASRPGAPRSDTPGSAAFPVPFPAVERCPAGGLRLPGLRLSVLGTCGNYAAEPSGFWRSPRTFDPSALPCVCILYKSKQQVKKSFLQKPKAKRKIFGSLPERSGKRAIKPCSDGKKAQKKALRPGAGPVF